MSSLIKNLRDPKPSSDFANQSDHIAYLGELRASAAAALVETAGAAEFILQLLADGAQASHPLIKDLLESARDSLRSGGNIDRILDLTDQELRPGSLVSRLISFQQNKTAITPQLLSCMASERLAAATKISELANSIDILLRPSTRLTERGLRECVTALEARCWHLPSRLPAVPELTAA